jgi:hypothetical protein
MLIVLDIFLLTTEINNIKNYFMSVRIIELTKTNTNACVDTIRRMFGNGSHSQAFRISVSNAGE